MTTPKALHDLYRSLTVSTVKGDLVQGIDVHEYRSNEGDNAGLNCTAGITEYKSLLAVVRKKGKLTADGYQLQFEIPQYAWNVGFRPLSYRHMCSIEDWTDGVATLTETLKSSDAMPCFYGKGSPGQIAKILRIAEALGEITSSARGDVQSFCTNYIGLDCSGFVTNYLNANGATIDAMDGAPAVGFYRPKAKLHRRESARDIQPGDVMAFAECNHVAAINDITRGAGKLEIDRSCTVDPKSHAMVNRAVPSVSKTEMEVVESCGAQLVPGDVHTDGLNCTKYTVESQNGDGSFIVKRQKLDTASFRVWIAPPGAFTA